MGNRMSFGRTKGKGNGKIVYWDGWVEELEKAVTVAELMLEHPQQVVVELHSALNKKRPIPLPADKTLDTNKVYLMLPMKRGKPLPLNTQHTRRILLLLNSALHSNSLLFPSTFLSRLARIGVKHKNQDMEKTTEQRYHYQCCEVLPEFIIEGSSTPEYLSRQLSGRGWKPSLDPIKENKFERNFSACASACACLFLKRF